jgi:hypothetical protein
MSTARSGITGAAPKVTVTPPEEVKHIVVNPSTGKVYETEEPPSKNGGDDPKVEFVEPTQEQMRAIVEKNMPTDEQQKYAKVWKVEQYRATAPGEHLVPLFLEAAGEIPENSTIIDWGCGTGRASKRLYEETDLDITMVDFVDNCLDSEVRDILDEESKKEKPRLRFIKQDLSKKCDLKSNYGFCTDVLEHIPPEQVDQVLDNVLLCSEHVFFQICTEDDAFGHHPDIQEDLHLTVENYFWWLRKFLDHAAIVLRSNELMHSVLFYVTGWARPFFRESDVYLNVDKEQARANIIANSKLDLQHIRPHEPQDTEIMLVCGGPTTLDFKEEIIEKRKSGVPLVTVNGSYNMVIDWGLSPSLQCMIDAREFNRRFVELVPGYTDTTKFIISTQCDPEVFAGLPEDRTYLWSISLDREEIELTKEYMGRMYEDWFPVAGGCTVSLRALPLLQMLGFSKVHVYGLDSCNFPEKHHAYDQPENDDGKTQEIVVAEGTEWEKKFQCENWQVYQAKEFVQMMPRQLKDMDLIVHGDGMIAYMVKTMAAESTGGDLYE